MKLRRKILLSLLGVGLVASLIACKNGEKVSGKTPEVRTIIAATGGAPKPFTYEEDGKLTGQNIDLLKAVFKKLPQYKLQIVKVEFSSMFSGVTSGRYQIAVNNLTKNEEREKNYLFSDPIFKNAYVVAFSDKSSHIKAANTWSDLAGLSTIGSAGVNTTTAIEEYNKANSDRSINLNYSAEDLKSQLEGVESGKYDFIVMDKPMFEFYQEEYDLNLIEKEISGDLESALLPEPNSYFVLGKEEKTLSEDINKALKEVIFEGTSKKINDNYFGEDYSPDYQ